MARIIKNIIFTFITFLLIFLFFLLIETFLWINKRSRSITRNDIYLYYTANPYFQSDAVHINRKFSRGDDFPEKKQEGQIRIIVMGDSDTFGWKLNDDETYPYILGEILNQGLRTKNYEVINFGTPGYTSLELFNLLKKHVYKYSPDILMVMIGWNDSAPAVWLSLIPYKWRKNYLFFMANSFTNQSAIVISLKESLKKFITKRIINQHESINQKEVESPASIPLSFKDYASLGVIKNNRVPINEYETNLKNIMAYCKTKNIRLIFITSPCGFRKSDFLDGEIDKIEIDYRNDFPSISQEVYKNTITIYDYMEIMKKVGRENKIPVVDCYSEFMKLTLRKRMPLFIDVFRDLAHPNKNGNYFIAETIIKKINDIFPAEK